jgi:hypothetical protein
MDVLLPVPIKYANVAHQQLDEQGQTNQMVLNDILRRVLQLLTYEYTPSAGSK